MHGARSFDSDVDRDLDDVGYYRIRPHIKPIMLADLAALPEDD